MYVLSLSLYNKKLYYHCFTESIRFSDIFIYVRFLLVQYELKNKICTCQTIYNNIVENGLYIIFWVICVQTRITLIPLVKHYKNLFNMLLYVFYTPFYIRMGCVTTAVMP